MEWFHENGEKVVNEDGFVDWMVHSTKDSEEISSGNLIDMVWSEIDADNSGTVTAEELYQKVSVWLRESKAVVVSVGVGRSVGALY